MIERLEVALLIAFTRTVSPSLADCALSFIERESIDVGQAMEQHRAYEACLSRLGLAVVSLPAEPDLPDAVFVEDTAVVVDELAVMTRPALDSRLQEVCSVEAELSAYRELRRITTPATLEGGDVLRIGRKLYVGLSLRTNREGVEQLASFLEPLGYEVQATYFEDCLHLKSACTYLGQNTILANRSLVDTSQFPNHDVIEVAPTEPSAGNALTIGDTVILPASFPETRERLEKQGFSVQPVDVSELLKAEAGVTCCSVIFSA
jgi:dimethylargininase